MTGYRQTETLIREYVSATKEAFPEMTEKQKTFLGAYENNLVQVLQMYGTSRSVGELYKKWDEKKTSILTYDDKIF